MAFDKYKEYNEKANHLEQALRAYNGSNDPKVKVASRQDLEKIINAEVPQANINNNTSIDIINQLGTNISARYQTFALDEFKKDPDSAIKEAKSKHTKQFEEGYINEISPYEIKNDSNHNEIAKLHKTFRELKGLISLFRQDQKSIPYDQFINQSVKYIHEAVKEYLGEDPTNLADLVASIYLTSSPNEALAISGLTLHTIQEKLEKLVPKGQRLDYAEKTLRAKSASGDKKQETLAAGELYQLIAA